jgi:aminoglycoside phosphotransferase (APT) family kinase protein
MERRYPIVEIGVEVAARLLEPLGRLPRPNTLQLLAGGHINTNYAITLDNGQRLVLRIFSQGEAALRKEAEVLQTMAGSVPIPHLHLAVFAPLSFKYPYAVLEWIEGAPLNEVLTSHPKAAFQIGEAVASTLLTIRERALPGYTCAPFVETIRDCLFERGAAQYLSRQTATRLWTLVQKQDPVLQELCGVQVLVHGDFQGDNILLRPDARQWRVAAVLDWEWAHSGCYLQDVGSLLRDMGETYIAFERGLESGFSTLGSPLPPNWRQAARIWDIAALCEKLACPLHRGEVTFRSIRIIERCLQDYAS